MKRTKLLITIVIFLGMMIMQGCSSSDKSDIKTDDPDKAYLIAKRNYDKRDYLQAIDDFSLIKIKFSGTKIIDKSQFFLGMCYFQRKEYILAAYEFEYLLKNYTASEYILKGRYQLAMCYYNMSPDFSLDQTYTKYAITELQNFIELYPNDKLTFDADKKLKEMKNKLAYKDYKNAELYMVMENYKAAIVYYETVLQNYFESDWADKALYGKIKALIIKNKKEDAKKEIERFEKKFPKSDLLDKVENIKKSL